MKARTAPSERPISDVLGDIVANMQDIIRSEVRLARSEVEQQISRAKAAATVVLAGILAGAFGVLFALIAIYGAISQRIPNWAAALCVAALMSIIAVVALTLGKRRASKVTVEKTAASVQETLRWAKQQTK